MQSNDLQYASLAAMRAERDYFVVDFDYGDANQRSFDNYDDAKNECSRLWIEGYATRIVSLVDEAADKLACENPDQMLADIVCAGA